MGFNKGIGFSCPKTIIIGIPSKSPPNTCPLNYRLIGDICYPPCDKDWRNTSSICSPTTKGINCGMVIIYGVDFCSQKTFGPIITIVNAGLSIAESNARSMGYNIGPDFDALKKAVRPYLPEIDTTLFVIPRNGRSALDILTSDTIKPTV